jgi:hypothetical protein
MDDFTTFEKSFVVQNSWARSGTLTYVYAEMAEEAYEAYQVEKNKRIPAPATDEFPEERLERDSRMTKLGIKSIVFTAMALEAGVFELAAINLGDETTKEYLDKLDVVSKWFLVPQLICGHSLAEKGPALNNLKTLVKARNLLVHCKSKPFPGYQADTSSPTGWSEQSMKAVKAHFLEVEAESRQFESYVQASFPTLVMISLELEALIGTPGPLPKYSKREKHMEDPRSPLLKAVISKCVKSHRNYHEKA